MMKKMIISISFLTYSSLSFSQSINFTFHNGSLKSIPLIIPSVMNPNLSPMSNSGITLDIGQAVYFYPNSKSKKRELLFKVDATYSDNQVLEIDQLIEKRKKELGIYR